MQGPSVWFLIKQVFKFLVVPDDFETNWYAFASNATSHASLGLFAVWLACVVSFFISGDIPEKERIFIGIAAIYAAKELALDKWNGWDTVEDFIFVVIYGAGGTLVSFTQIDLMSADVTFNIIEGLPVLSIFSAHLFIGVIYRIRKSYIGP